MNLPPSSPAVQINADNFDAFVPEIGLGIFAAVCGRNRGIL